MLALSGCCLLCDQPLWSAAQGVCSACCSAFPLLLRCPCCGLPAQSGPQACGRCLKKPPAWDFLVAVDDYRPPLSTLLNQLKFQCRFELAPALARLLLLHWVAQRRALILLKPDLLLPVPLYRTRQWRRGFNQAALLAAPLAHWLNIPLQENLLRRVRSTPPQQQLSADKRQYNLRQAFIVTEAVSGKRVALIDDVVTTGSTVGELSRLLRAKGADEIQIWSLCRTL